MLVEIEDDLAKEVSEYANHFGVSCEYFVNILIRARIKSETMPMKYQTGDPIQCVGEDAKEGQ